jgi:dipeptidyl aminopeptidase/acylaminoacyl peptidase
MRSTSHSVGSLLPLALAILATGAAVSAAAGPTATIAPPATIVARGIPPIPAERAEELLPYDNLRAANFADWQPGARRALILTRFAESPQVHEVAMPMGDRQQLTFYRDPVASAAYRPGHPEQILFSLNEGGAENFQLLLLDRKTGKARRLTDGVHRYTSPHWSNDGKLIAYASNVRNGRDQDLYVVDPDTGVERRLAQVQGAWSAQDWSPDDKRLAVSEVISANESYLYWIEVGNGALHPITPRPAGSGAPPKGDATTVAYGDVVWSSDGRAIYTTSDKDSELERLVRIDLDSGKVTVLSGDVPWEVDAFALSDDGRRLAFFVNQDGISRLHLLDAASGKALAVPGLPAGVVGALRFRPRSHELGFTVSWARSPSDLYSYDADSGKLERWTASEVGGLDPTSFAVPELIHYPTFDSAGGGRRMIPAFVYRPAADRFPGKRPVVVNIHGGPEGQTRPAFLGANNYLLNELGVAIVYPNVRGSTGYGKTYLKLDNGFRREDSVKDIGALLDWIATQPDLDASKVMVAGGSYGGYMSLAVMTFYSDRLACGYDSVGISNFVTFLEHTQDYRRDLRRAEYGDERDPKMRAFQMSIAPANHADRIKKPLLVAAGSNDPRVPLAESNQIAAAVEQNGVPVWYLYATDEGHGFQKKSNSDYLRAALFEFIRTNLLK